MDGSATNGRAIGGGGVWVTAVHPSNPTIRMSYRPAHGARPIKLKAEGNQKGVADYPDRREIQESPNSQ